MDPTKLVMKIEHQGFVIGIGKEHEQVRYWRVFRQDHVVADGFVEQQSRSHPFRLAVAAAQAAIERLLAGMREAEQVAVPSTNALPACPTRFLSAHAVRTALEDTDTAVEETPF